LRNYRFLKVHWSHGFYWTCTRRPEMGGGRRYDQSKDFLARYDRAKSQSVLFRE